MGLTGGVQETFGRSFISSRHSLAAAQAADCWVGNRGRCKLTEYYFSSDGNPPVKFDREVRQSCTPMLDRHRPFL
jgi:hypothetical protein